MAAGGRVERLPNPAYRDALARGEALSAVLVESTAAGLATRPVSHVTEIPSARAVIDELTGHAGVPQVQIRVGRIPEIDDEPPMSRGANADEIVRFCR